MPAPGPIVMKTPKSPLLTHCSFSKESYAHRKEPEDILPIACSGVRNTNGILIRLSQLTQPTHFTRRTHHPVVTQLTHRTVLTLLTLLTVVTLLTQLTLLTLLTQLTLLT